MDKRWLLCFASAMLACGSLRAEPPAAGKTKPLAEILADVQKRHAGRVVDIDLEHGADGRSWYEIKMLNGQRTKLFVDAVTGQEIPEPGKGHTDLVPLPKVLRGLAAAHPGLVLEAELEDGPGEPLRYDIKFLGPQGEPYEVRVDARTGEVLKGAIVNPAIAKGVLPLSGLLESLESRYRGRVTEAELKLARAQRPHYEVELVLESGRNLELRVDARSGQLLSDGELGR